MAAKQKYKTFSLLCLSVVFFFDQTLCAPYFVPNQKPTDCKKGATDNFHQYYDIATLQCRDCGENREYQTVSTDGLRCVCQKRFKLIEDFGGAKIKCEPCLNNEATSADRWNCVKCDPNLAVQSAECEQCTANQVAVERLLNGAWYTSGGVNTHTCQTCLASTSPNFDGSRCERCSRFLSVGNTRCECQFLSGGVCFERADQILPEASVTFSLKPADSTAAVVTSEYFKLHLKAAYGMCREYKNVTACEVLGNMCVLIMYDRSTEATQNDVNACGFYVGILKLNQPGAAVTTFERPDGMPWLYYDDADTAETVLTNTELSTKFNLYANNYDSVFHFKLASYTLDGQFVGVANLTGGAIQLCADTKERLDAAFVFGTTYYQTCNLNVDDLWDEAKYPLVFYDLFLEFEHNTAQQLYAVPVLNYNYTQGGFPNKGPDMKTWKLVRRFFLVDNLSFRESAGTTSSTVSNAKYVRYAQSMEFVIRLQPEEPDGSNVGKIYPPYLKITYGEISREDLGKDKTVAVSFAVTYEMNQDKQSNDFNIAIGILSGLAVVWAGVQTWSWSKRGGRMGIDFVTIIKFLLHSCGMISNAFFVVLFSSSLWWVVFFKRQDEVYLLPHTVAQEQSFITYLSVAFALKCIHVIHLYAQQLTIDIFFIDWERPRATVIQSAGGGQGDDPKTPDNPVSIWRTYFVANEWNEIQSFRKLNPALQIFAVVFFLRVVGFEYLASKDPNAWFYYAPQMYQAAHSRVFRFALGSCVYLLVAATQWLFVKIFYERFFTDAIRQFTDLCSVANISVFIMETAQYGYYIHGRSPHGRADTGLKEMADQLRREEENLCGHRGLMPNTDDQVFIMALPRKLRTQYERVVTPLNQEGVTAATRMEHGQGGPGAGKKAQFEKCVQAYTVLNRFLSSFVDHSLRDLDYRVKDKLLFESVLNCEFEDTSDNGIFYTDKGGMSYCNVLFYGNESTLMMFDVLLFSIVDLIAQDFILAGIITFIIGKLLAIGRDAGGERNLAKKTLVDERFLI